MKHTLLKTVSMLFAVCFLFGAMIACAEKKQATAVSEPGSDIAEPSSKAVRLKGEQTCQGLTFTVDQPYGDDGKILLKYKNGDLTFALGWVNPISVTLETTTGSFTTQLQLGIYHIVPQREDLLTIYFDGATGTPTKLYVGGVILLDEWGLPVGVDIIDKTVEISLTVE